MRGVAIRRLGILAVFCMAFCARDERTHLRRVDIETGNTLVPVGSTKPMQARDGHKLFTVTATLPRGFDIREEWRQPLLLDDASPRYRLIGRSLVGSDTEPSRIAATFEIPDNHDPKVLIVGKYRIDFSQSSIGER